MVSTAEIRRGMQVRTLDGKRLGKVKRKADGGFAAAKGLLFRHIRWIPFGEIDHVDGETLVVRTDVGLEPT